MAMQVEINDGATTKEEDEEERFRVQVAFAMLKRVARLQCEQSPRRFMACGFVSSSTPPKFRDWKRPSSPNGPGAK